MDIAAGRRSTLMNHPQHCKFDGQVIQQQSGHTVQQRRPVFLPLCVCVRERGDRISFVLLVYLHSYRQSDQFKFKTEDAR